MSEIDEFDFGDDEQTEYSEQEQITRILNNAAMMIDITRSNLGLELAYDIASVEWLDGYINRLRDSCYLDSGPDATIASVIGSYFGECIRSNFGGEWVEDEHGWAVRFDKLN